MMIGSETRDEISRDIEGWMDMHGGGRNRAKTFFLGELKSCMRKIFFRKGLSLFQDRNLVLYRLLRQ